MCKRSYTIDYQFYEVIKYLMKDISPVSFNVLLCLNHSPTLASCLKGKHCEASTPLKESHNTHLKLKSTYIFLGILFFRKVSEYCKIFSEAATRKFCKILMISLVGSHWLVTLQTNSSGCWRPCTLIFFKKRSGMLSQCLTPSVTKKVNSCWFWDSNHV